MEGDVVLTDISESGTSANVWQDEQGYVHLDDEGEGSISVEALSVTQNGTYTAPTGTAYSPVTVNVSGGGGGSALDQVRFIDYDGSVVHSYSKSDFMALSAMPSNPTHTGLTSQGWNWSLADAKNYLTDYPDGDLTIGQMYITDDGKTRLYCHFEEGRLHPYLGICPNGTVIVDWGDGSATSTLTGTSLTTVKHADHEYADAGDYIITLTVSSGSFAFLGNDYTSYVLKKDTTTSRDIHRVYTNCVQKIEMGTNATIGDYAFNYCCSLVSITIPDERAQISGHAFQNCFALVSVTIPVRVTSINTYLSQSCYALTNIAIPAGVTSIGSYAFQGCYALTNITIPDRVTSIGTSVFNGCHLPTNITIPNGVTNIETYTFYGCSSLANVTIPDGVTSIGSYAFQYCYSLVSATISNSVTDIGTYAFGSCYGMAEYHFLPTTPPTLANTNAFSKIQSDCIIYVPQGSLEAYQTATNWSTYASQMQEEPA